MKIYLVPTQHWDPFWAFGPEISEKIGVRNLRKALDIIRESPDFKYVVDQVYLWELFKKYLPERIAEFKERAREGKIILGCGGYVNPDFNLPSGESLIRQLAFAKRTWRQEFGINTELVWIQDSFGQSGQLPQIFSKLGLKFHTAKRGAKKDLPGVFIWQGVDGSQVLFDRQPLGHHGICLLPGFSAIPNRIKPWEKLEKITRRLPIPAFPLALAALCLPDINLWLATKGSFWRFKSALRYLARFYWAEKIFLPHGFGFDGAMPVNWVSYLAKIYSKLSRNKMVIASPREFLKDMEQERHNLPVIRGELNGPHKKYGEGYGVLPGVYSTRIDVKQRARKMERLLYLAELLETMKYLEADAYGDFSEIWKAKFLTDYHDGICGSQTDENYSILKERANFVISHCQKIIEDNLKTLAPREAVFNPLPWPRTGAVEINGRLILVKAPAMGIYPWEAIRPHWDFRVNEKEKTLTTPFYQVSWGKELKISRGGNSLTAEKFARFRLQKEEGDAYFWDVAGQEWDEIKTIKLIEKNAVESILMIDSQVAEIKITQHIHFYSHTPRIDFEAWILNYQKNIRLQACLSLNSSRKIPRMAREIPAGFLEGNEENRGQSQWREVFGEKFAYYDNTKCVQNWLYLGPDKDGFAIFNDGLPEHEIAGNQCFLTLLRCIGKLGTEGRGFFKKFAPENVPWRAGSPLAIPLAQEQGIHYFKYAFYPGDRENMVRECYEFLFPLQYCQGNGQVKTISLFSLLDKNVLPLAVKKAEGSEGIVIRLLETEGKQKEIELKLNPEIGFKSAFLADLLEEKIAHLTIENNAVALRLKPQEIATILLEK